MTIRLTRKELIHRFFQREAQVGEKIGGLHVTDKFYIKKKPVVPLRNSVLLAYRTQNLCLSGPDRFTLVQLHKSYDCSVAMAEASLMAQHYKEACMLVEHVYSDNQLWRVLMEIEKGEAYPKDGKPLFDIVNETWVTRSAHTLYSPSAEERLVVVSGAAGVLVGGAIGYGDTGFMSHDLCPDFVYHFDDGDATKVGDDWYIRNPHSPRTLWYRATRPPSLEHQYDYRNSGTCDLCQKALGQDYVVCPACGTRRLTAVMRSSGEFYIEQNGTAVTETPAVPIALDVKRSFWIGKQLKSTALIDPSVIHRYVHTWDDLYQYVLGRMNSRGIIEEVPHAEWNNPGC